jgi:hypothetical protein
LGDEQNAKNIFLRKLWGIVDLIKQGPLPGNSQRLEASPFQSSPWCPAGVVMGHVAVMGDIRTNTFSENDQLS